MPTSGMFDSLAEYPHWLVLTCSVLAAAVVIWVLLRLIKAAMWLLFCGLVLAAALSLIWYFFR
jgi:hypothetical protein